MLKTKFLRGAVAGAMLLSVGLYGSALAAPEPPQASEATAQEAQEDWFDPKEVAKDVAARYDVSEAEVLAAINAREDRDLRYLDDIYYGGILAKASGKSFQQVFSMKSDWRDVERKLGLSDARINAVIEELTIADISKRSLVPKAKVKELLEKSYHPRDIRIAGRIAAAAGKDVQEVLDMKKLNQRWHDVAEALKVDPKVVRPRDPEDVQEDESAAGATNEAVAAPKNEAAA